ncbi:MAG: group II intron reverse transcriptase/maturase [bacterium]
MNGREKSDSLVVPRKSPNKSKAAADEAEAMEGRRLAKGNSDESDMHRTQRRNEGMPSALDRVREAARRDGKQRFTTLMHHVCDLDRLRTAYQSIRKDAAAGVDRVTWEAYGKALEANLRDLADRLARGAYRAKPVRRAYIPKADGGQRPLGVPTLEDKIVQRSTAEVLGAIYEVDFLGFSYGFRPGRRQHDALDAVTVAIMTKAVRWVLDADIRGFFDTLDHGWLIKFIEHRIGDQRIIRLIRKWLNAGVLEDGERVRSEVGAVQGGSISPLLANIYLHYVLDLWVQRWRKKQAHGDVIVVRYADDFIVGFSHHVDGERFLAELRDRLVQFGLELHPEKTRLIQFGRFAAEDRRRRGLGKPETFDFLGLTHISGKTSKGKFTVRRKTVRKRFQAKLKAVKAALRRRLDWSIPKMGAYLGAVVRGHVAYYGVPFNSRSITAFRLQIGRIWKWVLERRSQRTRISWARMARLVAKWLPLARVCHPFPAARFGVITQGRSRMR